MGGIKGLNMFDMDNTDMNEIPFKPYDPLKSLFDDFMYRERTIIKDYWTGDKYKVIFRANADRNQMNDNSTIFYYADEKINTGSLLVISDEYYLVLNKQAVENQVYKQSDLVKCNTIFNGFSEGYEIVLPVHVMGLTSPYGNYSNTINTVSGNIEIITSCCELTSNIKEGSDFYAIGGKYSVQKVSYDNNNIIHIYAKNEAYSAPPTYTLAINLNESYKVDTTDKLTAIAKRTESSKTDIVQNPTFIWESSNNNIVSFNKNGLGETDGTAKFISVGEAEICVIWREHNIVETANVIVASATPKLCEITYTGYSEIKCNGSAKSFTAIFYDDAHNIDPYVVPAWSFEYLAAGQENNIKVTESIGNIIKIQALDKAPIGTSFYLVLSDPTGEYNTRLLIDIVDLW